MAKSKAIPGHKCLGTRMGFQARCECGWVSGVWFTEGARANAYGEWHHHVESHKREALAASQGV